MKDTDLGDGLNVPRLRPSTMSPAQRAAMLADHVNHHGWILEFVITDNGRKVHVVGPDPDQPGHYNPVDALLFHRFRTVCGLVVRKQMPDGTGTCGDLADELLCASCHAAFQTLDDPQDKALIFAHNTGWYQERAAGNNGHIRQLGYLDHLHKGADQ